MILTPYVPSDAFSLIVWLLINQSRHIRYKMKAEYLSYCIVLFISLLKQDLEKNNYQIVYKFRFFAIIVLNVDNSGQSILKLDFSNLVCLILIL